MTEQPFLTVTHGQLLDALELMGGVITSRPPVPVLGGVLITAHADGTGSLDCFDYETHVHVELDEAHQERTVLIGRKGLHDFVKSLLAGSTRARAASMPVYLSMAQEGSRGVVVEADGYRYITMGMAAEDYPAMPPYEEEQAVTVSRDTLLQACTRLARYAAKGDTIPMLAGINFSSHEGGMELASTDRFRMGIDWVPTVETAKLGPEGVTLSWLVPAHKLGNILKRLPGGPATLAFAGVVGQGGYARFGSGPTIVSIRWIEAEFVKYRRLLPTEHTADVVIDRVKLDTAIRRAASAIDRGHHIRLLFADSRLTVTAGGEEEDQVSSPPIPTEQDGDDMLVAFNPDYLTDALALYRTDSVTVRLDRPGKPILISEPGRIDEEHAFRSLVMPARLPTS
jgi:DNA polymerase III subunit beta